MKRFLPILFFFLFVQTFPQTITFLKRIGTGFCNSIVQTNDQGYIAVFYQPDNKLAVVRTDKYGEVMWQHDYGLYGSYNPAVLKTSDNNFIILASKKVRNNSGNIILFKINLSGDTLWTKTFDSNDCELCASFQKTKDGGLIIYGITADSLFGPWVKKQVIMKLGSDYTIQWKRSYSLENLSSYSRLLSIIELDDGYAWLTNKYLTKINYNGDIIWSDSLISRQYSLARTPDNEILLGGTNKLLKLDSNGNVLVEKKIYGTVYSICPVSGGSYVIATSNGIKKVNSECDTLWSRIFYSPAISFISQTSDGGYIAIKDVYNFLKTDSLGEYSYINLLFLQQYQYYGKAGNYVTIGEKYYVTWSTNNDKPIKIEFSTDDGNNWEIVTDYVVNSTNYNWLVPNLPSDKCKLKISLIENPEVLDISDRFTIGYNPIYDYIAVNQIKMWIGDNGDGSHDPNTEGQGLYWPGGENAVIGAVFEDGLLWGGKIDGEIRVNGNTHRQGIKPGKILPDGTAGEPVPIYKIKNGWQNLQAGPERDRYEYNYNTWPGDLGAPFIDIDEDGKFTKGIDQPRFLGDEVLWFAANDLDTITSRFTYGSDPIGLEIQSTTFGYDKQGDLGDVVFKKYKIINKSGKQIDNMYLAYWADPDLGDANDDYVGCDTTLNLGYSYNGNNNDAEYGAAPPAIGYQFVQGPVTEGSISDSARINDEWRRGNKNLPMTAFSLYIGANSTYMDPNQGQHSGALMFYNNMQGLIWNGNKLTDPVTNKATKFVLSGDPVSGVGWYEGKGWPNGIQPRDGRILLSTGPFNLAPSDTQEIVLAIIMARGIDNINSVAELKRKARVVQQFYDSHIPTAINDKKVLPTKFELFQNYPNPFNPSTTIKYSIPPVVTSFMKSVQLKVYDILGREIATLVNEKQNPGIHNYTFSIINYKLSSGVYFYRLVSGNYNQTKKMIILK